MDRIKYIKKEYLLDELSQFVSSKFGVIQATYFREDQNNLIPYPEARSMHENKKGIGIGPDIDVTAAMVKSLAKALERYTLIYARANGNILCNKSVEDMKSMGHPCFYLDHDVYEDFVYENNPYLKRMTSDLKIDWTAVRSFSNDVLIWLPASYVHASYQNLWTHILKRPSSNGMSCSFLDSAVEETILELIERDTFLYMWLAKSPGEEILFDRVDYEPLKKLIDKIGSKMSQIKVIYKYTDTQVPCLFVVFKGREKYNEPAFFISGRADTDIERACYRALSEFVSVYNSSQNYKNIIEDIKNFKIKTFSDRIAYYAMYENFPKCEFLFDVCGCKHLSELSKQWNIKTGKKKLLKNLLKDKNVFIVDVTPREIIKTNVRIVRSYSPNLLDLTRDETTPLNSIFGKKRVNTLDKVFNRETHSLNSEPHCYPLY